MSYDYRWQAFVDLTDLLAKLKAYPDPLRNIIHYEDFCYFEIRLETVMVNTLCLDENLTRPKSIS